MWQQKYQNSFSCSNVYRFWAPLKIAEKNASFVFTFLSYCRSIRLSCLLSFFMYISFWHNKCKVHFYTNAQNTSTIASNKMFWKRNNKKTKLIPRKCHLIFLLFINKKNLDLSPEQVTAYLLQNPDFLERHIMKEIELEQLERWMIRRTQQAKKAAQSTAMGKNGRKTSLSR